MFVFCFYFFVSSRRLHTRFALLTGVQTCALPISGPAAGIAGATDGLRRLDQHVALLAEAEPQPAVGAEIGAADLAGLFGDRRVVDADRAAADLPACLAARFGETGFLHQGKGLDAGIETVAGEIGRAHV